ncbi:uncharacterized protein LOC144214717 [Stigmatopora nigra]
MRYKYKYYSFLSQGGGPVAKSSVCRVCGPGFKSQCLQRVMAQWLSHQSAVSVVLGSNPSACKGFPNIIQPKASENTPNPAAHNPVTPEAPASHLSLWELLVTIYKAPQSQCTSQIRFV